MESVSTRMHYPHQQQQQQQPSPLRPLSPPPMSPRSALAATYATYVVRVHTRHGIKTISFDILANFFTYTAKKAAEDLGISSRTLIRVCRSLGIRRWPYLGFRSEKNVERIRHEAIENLRRKLEREGASGSGMGAGPIIHAASDHPAGHHHPTAACLRGASAKRLLQVKLPLPHLSTASPQQQQLAHALGPSPFAPTTTTPHHCVNTIVSPSAAAHTTSLLHHHHQQHPHLPGLPHRPAMHHHTTNLHHGSSGSPPPTMVLLTPPPTHQSFNLDRQPTLSPRRRLPALQLPQQQQQQQSQAMPSLNVLVDASILTAFKHEVESHLTTSANAAPVAVATPPPHKLPEAARTMSMRDILNHTAMAA